jgi:hypothetical protein
MKYSTTVTNNIILDLIKRKKGEYTEFIFLVYKVVL